MCEHAPNRHGSLPADATIATSCFRACQERSKTAIADSAGFRAKE